jgi:hypothetical protein
MCERAAFASRPSLDLSPFRASQAARSKTRQAGRTLVRWHVQRLAAEGRVDMTNLLEIPSWAMRRTSMPSSKRLAGTVQAALRSEAACVLANPLMAGLTYP